MTLVGHGIVTQVSQGIAHVFKCHGSSCHRSCRLTRRWLHESSTMSEITKNVAVCREWVKLRVCGDFSMMDSHE